MNSLKVCVGQTDNVYRLDKSIGTGSYGDVQLARTTKGICNCPSEFVLRQFLGKQVAIKKIAKNRKNYCQSDVEREVEAYKRFNHKNVVKFVEYFDDDEASYIVMEFIDGTDLCSLYESRELEPLPELEVKKIFRQIVEAVAYVHLKGVVHLDIKLENVLLDKQGRVSSRLKF